jgi:bile acid:Na+ symporter, BASS family
MAKPARLLSLLLNVTLLGTILTVQFDTLVSIPLHAFLGMTTLVLASLAAGWLLGGPAHADRTAMAMATSVRNVGLTLVIAVASFPATPAVTAATAFGLFQTILVALVAFTWGRLATATAK